MAQKKRRIAINKLEQAEKHLVTAAMILVNDMEPYMERFPDIKAVFEPCIISLDNVINGVKAVKEIL